MSLTPDGKHKGQCPFASLRETVFEQYCDVMKSGQFGIANSDALPSQDKINTNNREFTRWNREIDVDGLAQYVKIRCEQGEFSIRSLLRPGLVFAPILNFSIPDELSFPSPQDLDQRVKYKGFSYREVSDFLDVLEENPTILMAFQILQGFIGDYIKQQSVMQDCPYRARVFESLEEHYRLAANFIRNIPVSLYVASPPEERAAFTSASLNATTAGRGLRLLEMLDMFSFRASDAYPGVVDTSSELERVFTCPAKPFLMKVFGNTNVLEGVVGLIHQGLQRKIIPKVILDDGVQSSPPQVRDMPNSMVIVHDYIVERVQLIQDALQPSDPRGWSCLANNLIYRSRVEDLVKDARQKLLSDILPPNQSNFAEGHPS